MRWRRLAVRSYRSIAEADLKLGEVTVIVGESDSGKSNLVRALRDWAFNAKGDSMISVGATVCRVAVALEDGPLVAWEHRTDDYGKGGAGSAYYVRQNGETVEHRRIGVSVPLEIAAATGVAELRVDEDETVRVQFAEQSDPWFLLSSPPWTPGKVTKVVGKIAGLDTLILANRELERERIDVGRREKQHRLLAEDQRRALAVHAGLDRALELVASAQAELDRAKGLRARIAEASALISRMKARKESAARARAEVAALRPAIARAEDLGLIELLETESRVAQVEQSLAAREVESARAATARDTARKELVAARAAFEKLVREGDLACPTCGGAIHEECRVALAAEAKRS